MRFRLVLLLVLVLAIGGSPLAGQSEGVPVEFDTIRMTVPFSVASSWSAVFAGPDPVGQFPPSFDTGPSRLVITLENYAGPTPFAPPAAIYVYDKDFLANRPENDERDALIALLDSADPTAALLPSFNAGTDSSLPFLPQIGAAQGIDVRAEIIDLPQVRGIAYLTYYAQDISPFAGNRFYYTFQGLTHDDETYIAMLLPVTTPLFPNELPADFNYDAYIATYETYVANSLNTLTAASDADFTPNLGALRTMIESLEVAGVTLTSRPTASDRPVATPEVSPQTSLAPTPFFRLQGTIPVSFMGTSFDLPVAVAGQFAFEELLLNRPAGEMPTLDGGPRRLVFSFPRYAINDGRPALLFSYFIGDLAGQPEAEEVALLQQILASGVITPETPLPRLPIAPPPASLNARAEIAPFGSGRGIRYLSVFSFAVEPLTATSLTYNYIGISDDGSAVIAARMPVETRLFPNELPADFDFDNFNVNFPAIFAQNLDAINAAGSADFVPQLDDLDALIGSVRTGAG